MNTKLKVGGIYITTAKDIDIDIDFIFICISYNVIYTNYLYNFYTQEPITMSNISRKIDTISNKEVNNLIIKYKQRIISPYSFHSGYNLNIFKEISYLGQLEEDSYEILLDILLKNVSSINLN